MNVGCFNNQNVLQMEHVSGYLRERPLRTSVIATFPSPFCARLKKITSKLILVMTSVVSKQTQSVTSLLALKRRLVYVFGTNERYKNRKQQKNSLAATVSACVKNAKVSLEKKMSLWSMGVEEVITSLILGIPDSFFSSPEEKILKSLTCPPEKEHMKTKEFRLFHDYFGLSNLVAGPVNRNPQHRKVKL